MNRHLEEGRKGGGCVWARGTQVQTVAHLTEGVPGGSDSKESACSVRDPGPEDPLEERVAAPGDSHGPRSPRGRKEWDMAERLSTQSLRVSVLSGAGRTASWWGVLVCPAPVPASGGSPPQPRASGCHHEHGRASCWVMEQSPQSARRRGNRKCVKERIG